MGGEVDEKYTHRGVGVLYKYKCIIIAHVQRALKLEIGEPAQSHGFCRAVLHLSS